MESERPSPEEIEVEPLVLPESIKVDKEKNFLVRHKGEIVVIASPLILGMLAAAGYEIVQRRRHREK
ncbi:MAG: hypothetical protein WEC17_00615 [Candidatus Saccharimonadales bacterium]